MRRRDLLAVATSGGLVAIAGCLEMIGGEVRVVPDGMSVESHDTTGRVLEDGLVGLNDEIASYHTLFTDMETTLERLAPREAEDGGGPTADPEARSFIDDTDFDLSYIVIVQYGMPSLMSLALERIERIDSGIEVTVRTEAPNGVEDDHAVHSKILRITDEEAAVPEVVSAYIDDEPTDTSDV